MELIKTNVPGYELDVESGAIINVDPEGWSQFVAERNATLKSMKMEDEINFLKNQVEALQKLIKEKLNV